MIRFHKDGTLPQNDEVFVFGSNLAGIHGAGAAKVALEKFGAEWGVGSGFGKPVICPSYAIPTKDQKVDTLPLNVIKHFVDEFIQATKDNVSREWFVTRVGCGLAGYRDEQIAPMFKGAENCSFAEEWRQYIE
jgi:hypothetical protein